MSEFATKIIAVSGGSGSGKTTLVSRLSRLDGAQGAPDPSRLAVLQLDHYYKDLSYLPKAERDKRNFDHPDAFDTALLLTHLRELAAGRAIECPTYDFATHTRGNQTVTMQPGRVLVLDGILSLHWPEIRELLALAVYVDVDDDVRFIRRLRRDITERGRSVDGVIRQYLETVKEMHDTYVSPQKEVADIIVSWMDYNDRAVAMLAGMVAHWI